MRWYSWFLIFIQFLIVMYASYLLLQLVLQARTPPFFRYQWNNWLRVEPAKWLLKLFRIHEHELHSNRRALLIEGSGIRITLVWYALLRRIILFILYSLVIVGLLLIAWQTDRLELWHLLTWIALLVGLIAVQMDTSLLKIYREWRAVHYAKEIYVVTHQLLYFADSKVNIHMKLRKCIPFTHILRKDMEILLAEWFHDAEEALRNFKKRIATDEAISFVETIDALRQHQSDEYYVLLRERLEEYKERIELAKEGRKETTSYFLFVLSIVPILYNFQVFVYPWVQEVQQLLSTMNN